MSADFKIKNPKANSVLGMYEDEPIGMDHPLAKIKFQSEVDATLSYQGSKTLKEAIKSTLKHIRYLFGDDIPDALVRTAVSLTYAENVALKTKKWPLRIGPPVPRKLIDIDREYIRNWLDESLYGSRHTRKFLDARGCVDESEDYPFYPKAKITGVQCGVGWYSKVSLPTYATKEEYIAKVTKEVMGYEKPRRGIIECSKSEEIQIKQALRHGKLTRQYPYIAVYDCIIFFPDTVTKEGLIENAAQIAATWCPKAYVVWSSTETIWPKPPQQDS